MAGLDITHSYEDGEALGLPHGGDADAAAGAGTEFDWPGDDHALRMMYPPVSLVDAEAQCDLGTEGVQSHAVTCERDTQSIAHVRTIGVGTQMSSVVLGVATQTDVGSLELPPHWYARH